MTQPVSSTSTSRSLPGNACCSQASDLLVLSAFLLATGLRIGEAVAVIWRDVDLDLGGLRVTSTLIRVTGPGLGAEAYEVAGGGRDLLLPEWGPL